MQHTTNRQKRPSKQVDNRRSRNTAGFFTVIDTNDGSQSSQSPLSLSSSAAASFSLPPSSVSPAPTIGFDTETRLRQMQTRLNEVTLELSRTQSENQQLGQQLIIRDEQNARLTNELAFQITHEASRNEFQVISAGPSQTRTEENRRLQNEVARLTRMIYLYEHSSLGRDTIIGAREQLNIEQQKRQHLERELHHVRQELNHMRIRVGSTQQELYNTQHELRETARRLKNATDILEEVRSEENEQHIRPALHPNRGRRIL